MVNLKNKNIFDNFEFYRSNKSIKNIINFFGDRLIDLYMHFPNSINNNNLIPKLNLNHEDKFITIDIQVLNYEKRFNKRSPFKVMCQDNQNQLVDIIYFNINEYQIKNILTLNEKYRISGKVNIKNRSFQMIHPVNILKEQDFHFFDHFEPKYDLARKGINQKVLRKFIKNNFKFITSNKFPSEWIDKKFKLECWKAFKETLREIHFPQNNEEVKRIEQNRKRLAFDELLSSYLTFYELRDEFNARTIQNKKISSELSQSIIKNLPFELTTDQKICLSEIRKDLLSNKKMYRLIQGDVGSGKTIVALLMIADLFKNGFQSVLMVPTEILAKQHFNYFKSLLESYQVSVELLTSKTSQKDKKRIYEGVSSNKTHVLIGTHSVYNSSVKFKNLGLIVIDEQHKFGVKQRINLLEKSVDSNTLIMSATPIPRSLSFAFYGEISVSNIKSKPVGRKKVTTSIINDNKIRDLIDGIKRKIKKNEQVFWILPTIGSVEDEKENLLTRFQYLRKIFNEKVETLHGKLNKDEIEEKMNNFKNKKIMILVATTVVEVGINIPDATLMVIEQAEKFGLSQLHQLRGRINRGDLNANCVLIHSRNLSENSKKRLLILKNNDDGFDIAEKDLNLRGAGDFFGTNQSGIPSWKFFRPHDDYHLIECVKKNAEILVKNKFENNEKITFLKNIFYKKRDFKNFFSV